MRSFALLFRPTRTVTPVEAARRNDAARAWAVVPAGGEGVRLRSVTRAIVGAIDGRRKL